MASVVACLRSNSIGRDLPETEEKVRVSKGIILGRVFTEGKIKLIIKPGRDGRRSSGVNLSKRSEGKLSEATDNRKDSLDARIVRRGSLKRHIIQYQ